MMKTLLLSLFILIFLLFGFIKWTSSDEFTRDDRDVFNMLYKLNNEQLLQKCESMSNWSHVSGLTDGAFSPFGKTYYYKSRCFMTLAANTLQPQYCDRVRSRFSFINSGHSVSKETCLREVEMKIQLEAKYIKELEQKKLNTLEYNKIINSQIKKISQYNWMIHLKIEGNEFGTYQLDVINQKADFKNPLKTILTKRIEINQPTQMYQFKLTKQDLEKCGPNCLVQMQTINPLAFYLTAVKTQNQKESTPPPTTQVHNHTLSVD